MSHVMHVVSHTHWDREWYLPFQRFRMRLVDMMDHLLEILDSDPDFRHFNLDGQTIILEDYLQIRPERRRVIERYVREGRLIVGPWYVLNDEFLVSGESTIRSLLFGHAMAREFGSVMKVGYLPDQFGNISQMPQILQGFGIDNAIFGRGLQITADRKMEFEWRSPDGSTVLASLMAFWYNNAQRFPSDTAEAVAFTRDIRDRMSGVSHSRRLLLMNGVDHLEAQPDLPNILARVNEHLDGDHLVHSTLPAYVDALRDCLRSNGKTLDTLVGELREDRWASILAGTLSSRIYIKQANERCQTALEKYAEPPSAFAAMQGLEYPQGFIDHAWKLLMQNHPHDSICGCSTDQVHREMMPRFDQVGQVADELTCRALTYIANRVPTRGESLLVFNPLNWSRTDRVRAVVDLQIGRPTRLRPEIDPDMRVASIRILDENGDQVPSHIVSAEVTGKALLSPYDLPLSVMVKRFLIEFVADDVPPCGYRTYLIERCEETTPASGLIAREIYWDKALVNEYLWLSANGVSVCVERLAQPGDRTAGEAYCNLNVFEDTGDVGDEYLHAKPISNPTVTSLGGGAHVTVIEHGSVSATLKIDTVLDLPARADLATSARSEETVECPITSYLTVTRGVPRVDVVTVVKNAASDHRLRVLFPSGVAAGSSHADGQFDVVERPIRPPEDWVNASPFFPQQRWVDIGDGDRGLCIINKGLPEYEVYDDEARTLAVTLLRCVGRLSGGLDAPAAEPTPEAQCLGTHTFEYAIYPHAGTWEEAQVWMQANQHNVPLLAVQTDQHDGELPSSLSFLQTSHPQLVVSAIKKAQESDMLVVRLYNTTARKIEGAAVTVPGASAACLLNLNEKRIGDVTFDRGSVRLDVGPKKIVTLGFDVTV